ncbi:MAG: reprolysin-like metallopeptidase [Janthinobacterium lividum]|uniref:reprolysin-like metallopeptidase n=1 Tax=Pseudomonas sp. MWU16-30317 TaxID=2878095 RepID=UPI001CF9F394|nr:hypothetical protein [Pseudomonas sp. MWU16-30317]
MKNFAKARYLAITALVSLSMIAGQAFARPQPLQITLFVHQDVTLSTEQLHKDYLSHWEKAMTDISGREVEFEYITEPNDVTTMNYRNDNNSELLNEITKLTRWHFQANEKPGNGQLQKALLLTTDPMNAETHGLTSHLHNAGIASLTAYSNVAHELGHMFGATHENAKSGWSLCDSFMAWRNPIKAHCNAFSEANEDLIGEHLIQFP